MNGHKGHTIFFLFWLRSLPQEDTSMPNKTKDKESEAKAQLERLVKDEDEIAKKQPAFTPIRRRGGLLSD